MWRLPLRSSTSLLLHIHIHIHIPLPPSFALSLSLFVFLSYVLWARSLSLVSHSLSLYHPGPTLGLSSTVYAPNPPSENYKVQQESAESLTADLVMNHRKPRQYTLDRVFFCQSTMPASSGAHSWCLLGRRCPQSLLGKSYRAARVCRFTACRP